MTEQEFARIMVEHKVFPTKKRLLFQLHYLFGNIDFTDKAVLDIGGGEGLLSFYAALKGARKVICIEPESEGSSMGVVEKFRRINHQFQFSNVSIVKDTFQDFRTDLLFDIIVMYDSINHIDENACINLRSTNEAKREYSEHFTRLFNLTNKNGVLIIADCSNYNFWKLFRIRNPFAGSIEWHKHQSPEIWSKLAENSGFIHEKQKWSSINRFGNAGKLILGNRVASYFLNSHFLLYLKKL
jgi:cyclopropane fatty-acyl-phospholipid synthase-like methyltransferase